MDIKLIRRGLLVACALVAVLLIYAYLSSRGVQDPSNNESLSQQFDALNPGIASADDGTDTTAIGSTTVDDGSDDGDGTVANS